MKKINIFKLPFTLIVILFFSFETFADTCDTTQLTLYVINKQGIPKVVNKNNQKKFIFSDTLLQNIFCNNPIIEFLKAYPAADFVSHPKAYRLRNIYMITFLGKPDSVVYQLNLKADHIYKDLKIVPNIQLHYTPNDYGISGGFVDADDALDLIKIQQAWDITKGSSDIKIAIVDDGFDPNHEDLKSQIVYMRGNVQGGSGHGTRTAGCAAAAPLWRKHKRSDACALFGKLKNTLYFS